MTTIYCCVVSQIHKGCIKNKFLTYPPKKQNKKNQPTTNNTKQTNKKTHSRYTHTIQQYYTAYSSTLNNISLVLETNNDNIITPGQISVFKSEEKHCEAMTGMLNENPCCDQMRQEGTTLQKKPLGTAVDLCNTYRSQQLLVSDCDTIVEC